MQITPLPAGHMIGGTIWKIVKDGEEEIVYALDYNHKKERCRFDSDDHQVHFSLEGTKGLPPPTLLLDFMNLGARYMCEY